MFNCITHRSLDITIVLISVDFLEYKVTYFSITLIRELLNILELCILMLRLEIDKFKI